VTVSVTTNWRRTADFVGNSSVMPTMAVTTLISNMKMCRGRVHVEDFLGEWSDQDRAATVIAMVLGVVSEYKSPRSS
jgi:hypothetical protein